MSVLQYEGFDEKNKNASPTNEKSNDNTFGLILDKENDDFAQSELSYKQQKNENLDKIKAYHSEIMEDMNQYYIEHIKPTINSPNVTDSNEAKVRLENVIKRVNTQLNLLKPKLNQINNLDNEIIEKLRKNN